MIDSSEIQPIRQTVCMDEIPARLKLERRVFTRFAPEDIKLWLLKLSGACWYNVQRIELTLLPDRRAVMFVGYFKER